MGIWAGRNCVKLDYQEKLFGDLSLAVDVAHSVLLLTLGGGATHIYLDNTLDVWGVLAVVNPAALKDTPGSAPVPGNKIFLLKLGPNRVLNLDQVIPDSGVEGGTQFWLYTEGASPASTGRFSVVAW